MRIYKHLIIFHGEILHLKNTYYELQRYKFIMIFPNKNHSKYILILNIFIIYYSDSAKIKVIYATL